MNDSPEQIISCQLVICDELQNFLDFSHFDSKHGVNTTFKDIPKVILTIHINGYKCITNTPTTSHRETASSNIKFWFKSFQCLMFLRNTFHRSDLNLNISEPVVF